MGYSFLKSIFHIIWYSSSFFYLILIPLSWIYGLVGFINRLSYQIGWRKQYKFSVSIVVIGNLTVGGNGKTPLVLWLVTKLKQRGWNVGVVSRGYGGKSCKYPIVVNSINQSHICGDEPVLIWLRTGVLVAVSPNRSEAVEALLKIKSLDIIICDDGLQHYSLYRDIEWVVVNNIYKFGNGWWLPAGPMRERINRLKTVQAVIVHGSENYDQSKEILMKLNPIAIINLLTKQTIFSFSSERVVAIAGIGYPMQFFSTLHNYGIFPVREISFPDHYIYSEKELLILTKKNEVLLMTEKDAVKCLNFAHKHWWYLHLDTDISEKETEKLIFPIEKNILLHKKFF